MAYSSEHSINALNGLKSQICAASGHHSKYQPPYQKESGPDKSLGSQAWNPIAILDDDEPDAAKVNFIDLEDDNKASTKGHHTAPISQAMPLACDSSFQSLAESHASSNHIQGPDPARLTERVTQPLFRALTQDDLTTSSAQEFPETQTVGFKAWYRARGLHHTGKTAPGVQPKEVKQAPSITLSNKVRPKKTARVNEDAPHFPMSVLKSHHKRTIGELRCNELISPAQIESPSEKLARTVKKRRQRQERCDIRPRDRNAGEAQRGPDLDQVQDRENGRLTREYLPLAVSPIANEALDKQEIITKTDGEGNDPTVVCAISPVSICALPKDQRHHTKTQFRKGQSDDHVETPFFLSTQITPQDHDAQEHRDSNNSACSNGSINRKPKNQRSRICGPTNVCGVFSPEKKPPVKRSSHGEFHCPRCDSQFTRRRGVNYHFETCVAMYGNPESLRWTDHPSLGGVGATGFSTLSETHSLPEEQASCSDNKNELHHQIYGTERGSIGGKGLSAETLKIFRETGNWDFGKDPIENVDKIQDEKMEVLSIAYQYSVFKREWLETEEDAIESIMGPYYTLNEASAVAKAEVQCPQIDGFEVVDSRGWSYYYRQDEHGMQLHLATILGINIEAVVRRELAPAHDKIWIPMSALAVAQQVYVVQELQWLSTAHNTTGAVPVHCQSLTHGVFTLLKRANQRAAAEYVESLTGNWSDSEEDVLKRAEMKSDMDKKVRELNGEGECFCEEIRLENEGFAKVWVESVVVEGPRN